MVLRKGWNGKGEEADVEGNACRGGSRWGGEDAVAKGNGRMRIGGGCGCRGRREGMGGVGFLCVDGGCVKFGMTKIKIKERI